MPLLATVTVDFAGRSQADAQTTTVALAPLGLLRDLDGTKGRVHLPPGTWCGVFPGESAGEAERLQQRLTEAITEAFLVHDIQGPFFVVAAAGWSWHYRPLPRHRSAAAPASEDGGTSTQLPVVEAP